MSRVRFINRDNRSTETHRYSYTVQHTLTLRDTHPRRDTQNTPTDPSSRRAFDRVMHACVRAFVRVIRSFVRSIDRVTLVRSSARVVVMSRVSLVSPTTATAVRTRGRRGERCESPARDASSRNARRRARRVILGDARGRERMSVRGGGGRGDERGMQASERARAAAAARATTCRGR